MPHSAKDAKGGNFFLPRCSWMGSLEHVPVAVLGFLGLAVSQDYKPEISNPHIKVSGGALSQSRGNNYKLQPQVKSSCSFPVLSCTHPLLSCSSLVLTSLLKASWSFLFWSFASLKVSQGQNMGTAEGHMCSTAQQFRNLKIKKVELSQC